MDPGPWFQILTNALNFDRIQNTMIRWEFILFNLKGIVMIVHVYICHALQISGSLSALSKIALDVPLLTPAARLKLVSAAAAIHPDKARVNGCS